MILPILPEGDDKQEDFMKILKNDSYLDRIHVFVIGPGLGRDSETFKGVLQLIDGLKKKNKYFVLDGDGLYLLSQHPDILKDYNRAILTPNVNEYSRLI